MKEIQYRIRYKNLTGSWFTNVKSAIQYLHADPEFIELDYINLDNIEIETRTISDMEKMEYRAHYKNLTGEWFSTEEAAREHLMYNNDFKYDDIDPDHIRIETRVIKSQKIINLTSFDVNILGGVDGRIVRTYPKSGITVRLKERTSFEEQLNDGTIIVKTVFKEPENLPEYKEGVYYIVSQLIKSTLHDRKDLLVPADVMCDENGNIVGCYALSR